jgi:hypothetical protein
MSINRSDVIAAAALCVAGYFGYKFKKLSDKYEEATDKIAEGLDISVDDEIIKDAVDKAVDREVSTQVRIATNRAVNIVTNDIHDTVKKAVKAEEANLKESTRKAIERCVSDIDISKAKEEVIERAQDIVADRLEEDTKVIAKTYENSIKNVADLCEKMISTASTSANEVRRPIRTDDVETIIKIFKES